jgi:hypothetical protein
MALELSWLNVEAKLRDHPLRLKLGPCGLAARVLLDRGTLTAAHPHNTVQVNHTWRFSSSREQQVVEGVNLRYEPSATEKIELTFFEKCKQASRIVLSRPDGAIKASLFSLCDWDRPLANALDVEGYQDVVGVQLKAPVPRRLDGKASNRPSGGPGARVRYV